MREVLAKYLYTCDGYTRNGHFCDHVAVIEAVSPERADEIVKESWGWRPSTVPAAGWLCGTRQHRSELAAKACGNHIDNHDPDG